MKRLAILIVIITLPVITYYQYQKYRRFHPPVEYSYTTNDSIDVYYYDPAVLQHYYKNVYEIGAFARQMWYNKQIDVRFPDENDTEAMPAARYYQQLLQTTAYLEGRLIRSQQLKQAGFTNQNIKVMEAEGLSPLSFYLTKHQSLIGLARGEKNASVWQLQKLLRKHDHDIPLDGIFNKITEQALQDFQQSQDLYPSGQVDEYSLRKLLDQ
ncbi:peptidoglycan-binding domain-containing protein [Tunicatimonas pelagia]|uniref:peptidoglycan-binding domain-containing protein n=1 Tax=Tunicatimonas pelagia TaxID=931531 RepID=UPI0026666DFF|nr:peptidoglycan-binding domain-containing protein [Tunicatimonas pelagia]WKN44761.1 peptidoglycan-binding domain-containing protein [Tunicatimonas pelagia]